MFNQLKESINENVVDNLVKELWIKNEYHDINDSYYLHPVEFENQPRKGGSK